MCFNIHSKHPEEKTAKKNLVCYKILEGKGKKSFISPFQQKRYDLTPKKIFKANASKLNKHGSIYTIERGLHSYSNLKYATKKAKCDEHDYNRLIQFVIPKGSKYYYNPLDQEYVSLQLRFVKILK